MINEEQYEAVLERKMEIFKQQIDAKTQMIGKHAAIKEFKKKWFFYKNSQTQILNFKKTWSLMVILLDFLEFFRRKVKVFILIRKFFKIEFLRNLIGIVEGKVYPCLSKTSSKNGHFQNFVQI